MKVGILGSGPSLDKFLPAAGYHTIAVGGGGWHGDWHTLFLNDQSVAANSAVMATKWPSGYIQKKELVATPRAAEGVFIPKPYKIWDPFMAPKDLWASGPRAVLYAVHELGADEVHITGCDCCGLYRYQIEHWGMLKEYLTDWPHVKVTCAGSIHSLNPLYSKNGG